LVIHQVNGEGFDPFTVLSEVGNSIRELARTASCTPRTELDLPTMLCYFELERRKIEDLTAVIILDIHIDQGGFALTALTYLMNNDSIRIGDLSQKMRLVVRLSARFFLACLTERSRFLFEGIRGRRLVRVVAIAIETSFKFAYALSESGNLKLLLVDDSKQAFDEFNDCLRATIIYSFYLITIHRLLRYYKYWSNSSQPRP
jgi:hypothetical protein